MPGQTPPKLTVAIVGGGPGGLATAISLSTLPNTDIKIYEKARELREIGAGIQIGYNCWRVLELLGCAEDVKGHVQTKVWHRNGRTGEAVAEMNKIAAAEPRYRGQRVRRTNLQRALLKRVPEGVIKLRKRLTSLDNLDEGGVRLRFEDGEETIADLVVGGDGIRSVVREFVFPDHAIAFTGRTIWRVIIPKTLIDHIPDMKETSWWHGENGHFYNCLVDDPSETPEDQQMFEIACHNVASPLNVKEKKFSWGIPATNERVESHFRDYDPRVREALAAVPPGLWKEFSSFSGPRLKKVIAWDKVVLIGDASHPLTGAFGSGAAFAMQDGYILAQAINHTRSSPNGLAKALEIFDSIRSPYYHRMYEHLDAQRTKMETAKEENPNISFEQILDLKVASFGGEKESMAWIYQKDIVQDWEEFLAKEDKVAAA